MDRQTDGGDCITSHANTVSNHQMALVFGYPPTDFRVKDAAITGSPICHMLYSCMVFRL